MAAPASALTRRVVADARARTISFALLFATVVAVNAAGYKSSYPTFEERERLVATFADNKAARMLYGAGRELTSVGGYTAWRAGGLLVVFAALFGIFAAGRAMRGDEEAGRAELVLAGALSRTRAFGATLLAIALTIAVVTVATILGLVAAGLPLQPSSFLALGLAAVAVVYTAIGAVANELAPTRRGALGLASAVLGADFAVRVVADTTDHLGLHWVTPLGWAEELRAFTGSRSVVLLLPVGLSGVLLAVAAVLHAHRDVGASYLAPRDTAEARPRLLTSPTRLAFRLERVAATAWVVAIFAFAFIVGTVAKSVENIELGEELRRRIAKLGGIDITTARGYIGLTFVIFIFAIALFVCSQIGTAADDERFHRIETLFALPYGRRRWIGGRVTLALAIVAACALAAGLGVEAGVVVSRAHLDVGRALEASLNCIPPEVLFLGIGVLAFGWMPRHAVGITYAIVVVTFVWELFGALLSAPNWALDLSPFHHLAPVPAKPISWIPALAMTAAGIVAGAIGVARWRARDLAGD